MDEFQGAEETSFVVDEVSNIIKESVEGAIGGNAYQHNKVNQWTSNVVEQCLNQLTKLGKPFKYIVTCVIMQKNGAGLHTASSCFWDNTSDGSCTVRWENKTILKSSQGRPPNYSSGGGVIPPTTPTHVSTF
ncbi:dynein light chain Tctex-type 1-like [Porites lutea]|uniref:dynein light chain Tctex-type 1-like n=1 Tax=Porites lutea TaxID=51062 RepID=UPI003CC52FB0